MASIVETAPAKINLCLHVLGRRPDGYHEIDSLIAFAAVGDRIAVAPSTGAALDIGGPFARDCPAAGANLVMRAAMMLAATSARPLMASMHLDKQLPVAAGIGGGSADAAAALRALQQLWKVEVDPTLLTGMGLALGADVPVCLAGQPSRVRGIGERIDVLPPLPAASLVLVHPSVPLPTADVFAARRGAFGDAVPALPKRFADVGALAEFLRVCRNDLTEAAIACCPPIESALAALDAVPGCLLARMTGSGATCFGLFADDESAQRAERAIAGERRQWWVRATALKSD
ncbi:MAG: 4-(cytidine 5'-diphospho)-2-C-methyl-D-erythritol kinase [Dongiaceae bacterium]